MYLCWHLWCHVIENAALYQRTWIHLINQNFKLLVATNCSHFIRDIFPFGMFFLNLNYVIVTHFFHILPFLNHNLPVVNVNTVNFLQNTHERQPITCAWCWDMGNVFCVFIVWLLHYLVLWGLWCQKQAWISNCISQNTVGWNDLPMPKIPASGTEILLYWFRPVNCDSMLSVNDIW